jgi:hypothetical protein
MVGMPRAYPTDSICRNRVICWKDEFQEKAGAAGAPAFLFAPLCATVQRLTGRLNSRHADGGCIVEVSRLVDFATWAFVPVRASVTGFA